MTGNADLTNQRCVMTHRGKIRPYASVGLVCREHLDDLRDMLADVADYYAELPYVQHPLAVAGERSPDARQTKKSDPPAPLNLTALAVQDSRTRAVGAVRATEYRNGPRLQSNGADVPDVAAVLASWCEEVATDRNTARPAMLGVAGAIDYLRLHLSWIVEQDWLRDFERELRACQQALATAVGGDPRPPTAGECPYCGTILYRDRDRNAIKLRRQGRDPAEAKGSTERVRCTFCGALWEGRPGLARLTVMQGPEHAEAG